MSGHLQLGDRPYPRRRHGQHRLYVRPVEARKVYNWLDALARTDEQVAVDEDVRRFMDKLYAVEWDADGQGVDD